MEALQIIWFILIFILLGVYAVLDGFDLGVGFWSLFAKTKENKKKLLEIIGPFWDGNEVWLLTGAGAIFAAFPPVYATVFSGFYLAMILVLMGLIFRAVSIEFRNQVENDTWQNTFDKCFSFASMLPAILFGVAVGNLVRGIPLNPEGIYTKGFLALLNPYALFFGLTSLLMFILHGASFIKLKTDNFLFNQSANWIKLVWPLYIICLIIIIIWTYMHFLIANTVIYIILSILTLICILMMATNKSNSRIKPFLFSSISILLNWSLVAVTLFPYLVPNLLDRTSGLSIYNASASKNTLTVMLILAIIGMPIVILYTIYIYRIFSDKKD